MEQQKEPAEEFRKSIYLESHNQHHKEFILDTISRKLGKQNLSYIMVTFASIVYPLGFLYSNQHNFSPYQTSLMRGIVTIVINYMIVRYYNIEIDFKDKQNFKLLCVRNLIMAGQGIAYAFLQFYLTQPIIQTLTATGPLFIFLLDYKINGIIITVKQFYGVVFGILGVVLTVNGDMIIHLMYPDYTTSSEFKHYSSNNPIDKLIAAAFFVGVQFFWAYAAILTKQLKGINSIQINFHMGFTIMAPSALLYMREVAEPVATEIFFSSILYGGLLMVSGQLCFIGALTMNKNTGILTILSFISVIVGYIVSIIKYKEAINPFCTFGALLIIFGLAKIVLKMNENSEQKPISMQKQKESH